MLTSKGEVFTFGKDCDALGRKFGDCMSPGKMDIKGRVVELVAGNGHTLALTQEIFAMLSSK